MRTESKNGIKEIVADNGKLLKRKGTESYFSRYIMFANDTADDFEEINENEVPQPETVEDNF